MSYSCTDAWTDLVNSLAREGKIAGKEIPDDEIAEQAELVANEIGRLRAAEIQRNELAAALDSVLDQLDGIGVPDWHGAEGLYLDEARAALAKVRP